MIRNFALNISNNSYSEDRKQQKWYRSHSFHLLNPIESAHVCVCLGICQFYTFLKAWSSKIKINYKKQSLIPEFNL